MARARKPISKKAIGVLAGAVIGIGASGHFATESAYRLQMSEAKRELASKTNDPKKKKALLRDANRLQKGGSVHSNLAIASAPAGAGIGLGIGALMDRKKKRRKGPLRRTQDRPK